MPEQGLIRQFVAITGARHALREGDELGRYTLENRGIYVGRTMLVLKPASTAEVARIVKLAVETGTAIVPQGGHTGHVGGAVPDESGEQLVVSMERMNRIIEIDSTAMTARVEAGVVLAALQDAAAARGLLFPLSLGSQGSCQIGGNIATNAGGTGVLAHGSMRELVLGLEVVLPSGEIWDGMRSLRKDNTGYSLKNLFVGSEGTLGIVTKAVLRLFPAPKGREVAWAGLESPEHALRLYGRARELTGSELTAFELIHRTPLEFLLRHVPGSRDPLAGRHEWYVLAQISSPRSEQDARRLMESLLAGALAEGQISDAAIAQNLSQRDSFWKMREEMPGAQIREGASIKHDISVPVHLIPALIEKAGEIVAREFPGARPCVFGHMGDGNLHYNISQPAGGVAEEFLERRERINSSIHALVLSMDGSIAAEHGIGRLKRAVLAETKSAVEIGLMRTLKQAFDPQGIMNPGKLI